MGNFSPSRTSIQGATSIIGRAASASTRSGAGMVSTLNGLRPVINIVTLNNVTTTTIQVALKGNGTDIQDIYELY